MTIAAGRSVDAAQETLLRATDHLLGLQQPSGWWKGELETNVTIEAEDLFLRHYLGLDAADTIRSTATWIRGHQRPDGSWATFHGGPADLSTSVEAYVALRLAGDPAQADHMRRAASFIRDAGGVETSRVFTRMWLSLIALWSWDAVPTLPPEQILLPPRAPLSVYQFGCWARQTIVALSVVTALQPRASVPFGIDELRTGNPTPVPSDLWGRVFVVLDQAAHRYERHARAVAPPAARCERPSAGSSTARSGTARGAASSRRGSGRSWPCARSATGSTIRCSRGRCPASRASRSRTTRAGGSRPASRRCGTRHWR